MSPKEVSFYWLSSPPEEGECSHDGAGLDEGELGIAQLDSDGAGAGASAGLGAAGLGAAFLAEAFFALAFLADFLGAAFFADFLAFFADFFADFLADFLTAFLADLFFAAITFLLLAFLPFFFLPLAIVILLLSRVYRALEVVCFHVTPIDQFDSGRGPPVAQSRSSIVCTTGTDVPPAICTMHPILPAAIMSGLTIAMLATFRSRNLFAMSGWRML
jgi:hypothetical protein